MDTFGKDLRCGCCGGVVCRIRRSCVNCKRRCCNLLRCDSPLEVIEEMLLG